MPHAGLQGCGTSWTTCRATEDELGPDALFVEVLQAQFDVVGARCAVARGVELFLRNVGEPATERLSVDEDGLPLAVGILLGTGDEIGEMLGQACAPQIVGLEEVRITGIGPQLLVGHFGLHSFVRGWLGTERGFVLVPIYVDRNSRMAF